MCVLKFRNVRTMFTIVHVLVSLDKVNQRRCYIFHFISYFPEEELHDLEVRMGKSKNLTDNLVCRRYRGRVSRDVITVRCESHLYGE